MNQGGRLAKRLKAFFSHAHFVHKVRKYNLGTFTNSILVSSVAWWANETWKERICIHTGIKQEHVDLFNVCFQYTNNFLVLFENFKREENNNNLLVGLLYLKHLFTLYPDLVFIGNMVGIYSYFFHVRE